jgi:hypothetical protein
MESFRTWANRPERARVFPAHHMGLRTKRNLNTAIQCGTLDATKNHWPPLRPPNRFTLAIKV